MSRVQNTVLSKPQEECVNFDSGDLLVKGVAGSGKSLVVMRRALRLYAKNKGTKSIKLFTYANSLVKYTSDLFESQIPGNSIEVLTVDSYCLKVYYRMTGKSIRFPGQYCKYGYDYTMLGDDEYPVWISAAVQEHQRRSGLNATVYKRDNEFWKAELIWIREKCLKTREDYINADRKGRGSSVRLRNSDKNIVWEVYEIFENRLKREFRTTWEDLYLFMNDNLSRIPNNIKVDYIFVDEAQDMTLAKMKFLKALTRESITIAADLAQKIYKTSFTWKEVGIDIKGRSSKELLQSFRCTRQIVELAEDLMRANRENSDVNDEYTSQVLPEAVGNKPSVYMFSSVLDEKEYMARYIQKILEGDPEHVIGIICRTKTEKNDIKSFLESRVHCQDVDNTKADKANWNLLQGGVKLITCHSSKGLEFDTVIIPDFNDTSFPLDKSLKNVDEEQKNEVLAVERSLLYVAMTRARQELALFCIKGVQSRFLSEFKKEHYEVKING